jgi:large subunit ribosomal protein L10
VNFIQEKGGDGLKFIEPAETNFWEILCFEPLPLTCILQKGEEVNMDRKEKEQFVADLHDRLEKAQGTFLVEYKGLDVETTNKLRGELRKVGTEFQVVKNRLLKLASRETDTALIEDQMTGPSAIALTYEDLVAPAKVLVDFAKDHKRLKIKSGQISGKAVDMEAVKRLAELPGREVLLAQTLAAMQAVPASFVRLLNGIPVQLMNVLRAIEQQKEASA